MDEGVPGFLAWLPTASGYVPRIDTRLNFFDHLGACKARWGIGRMDYRVPAGLYAIGLPDEGAPIVVTANYRMSYDMVRRALSGRNVWLLVLETFGVNVWCAAGKGSFGTEELKQRIETTGLASVVNHRRLILPKLGAPGVSAHLVKEMTGFTIDYGPIRANDLPEYLDNGRVVTAAMDEFTFSFYERLVLIPVEIVLACKSLPLIAIILFIAAFISGGMSGAVTVVQAWLGAVLSGLVVGPLLLPWIPGRRFSVKGALVGLVWAVSFYLGSDGDTWSLPARVAAFLALPTISAYYTLNFTGCTNFTSRSGVKREMREALPIMAFALIVSVILMLLRNWLE
jgi:acetyl-CoA decarbonylase/synthase complex subunit gamma